jgi:sodium/bile acid cotransporter 7
VIEAMANADETANKLETPDMIESESDRPRMNISETPSNNPKNPSAVAKVLLWVLKELRSSWIKYHLLWLLIFAITIGVAWPLPGKTLGDARLNQGLCLLSTNDTGVERQVCVWSTLSSLAVTLIFWISGLQLKLEKMKKAFGARRPILVGHACILLFTSSFAYAIAAGPKLSPKEFSFGLALFALMPTTLSSCIVIVGYANGDQALALLLTVSTNLLGVAILPVTATWLIEVFYNGNPPTQGGVKVNVADLCLSLVFTVLIPLFIGIVMRCFRKVAFIVDKLNFTFKVTNAALLAAIPWMKISQSNSSFGQVAGASYVVLIITSLATHIFFLLMCLGISCLMMDWKKDLAYIKCNVIVGAQKTMPVALSVLELLPVAITGHQGLVAVAIVVNHLIQTILDSFLALQWAARTSQKQIQVKEDSKGTEEQEPVPNAALDSEETRKISTEAEDSPENADSK